MTTLPRWTEGEGSGDAELQQALREARRGPSEAQVAALRARLAQRVADRAERPATPVRLGARWKGGLALLTGLWLLAGGLWLLRRQPAQPSALPQSGEPDHAGAIEADTPPPPSVVPSPTLPLPEPSRVHPAPKEPVAQHRKRTLRADDQGAAIAAPTEDELGLLQAANRALLARPAQALELAQKHARQFAQGVFAEEREAIAIEALLRLGRASEAAERHQRFQRAFPSSTYRQRLDRLRGEPTNGL